MIKKIFVICVVAMGFLSHVMAQENIFVLRDGYIYPKKKFIDSLAVADKNMVKPYETFATSTASIRSGRDKNYQVRLSKFKGGGYPGDFQAIQIFLGNKCLLEVTNADGWTSLPPNVPSTNSYYFAVNVSAYSTALFFFSQPKDNYPPYLTIVLIKTGKAHLVFNRPCVLQSISKNSYSVRLEMDDRYPVYVAPAGTTSEVTEMNDEKETEVQVAEEKEQPKKRKRRRRRSKSEIQVAQPDTVKKIEEPAPVVKKEEPKPVQPTRYLIWSENDVLKIKEQ